MGEPNSLPLVGPGVSRAGLRQAWDEELVGFFRFGHDFVTCQLFSKSVIFLGLSVIKGLYYEAWQGQDHTPAEYLEMYRGVSGLAR